MDESAIPSDVLSLRSYASSIISTGTKTSVETFTQPHPHQNNYPQEDTESSGIDVHLSGHRNYRITARPGSILSISSFEPPCPPYENPPSTNASTSTLAPAPSSPSIHPQHALSSLPPLSTNLSPTLSPSPSPTSLQPTLSTRPASPTSTPSPTLPDPTTLSRHYTLVVRTIDANHRAEIARLTAAHAASLSQTRHAIDAAYRVALRAKDAEVERVREEAALEVEAAKKEVEALTAGIPPLLQMAKNEVEDLWEKRWRERAAWLEEEVERKVEQARAEEKNLWLKVLGRSWPARVREWQAMREAVAGTEWGKGLG